MTTVLRAELRKLRTTRSLWLMLLAGVGLCLVGATALITAFPEQDLADRLSEHGPLHFGPTNVGLLLVLFGVRLVGDEWHHGTLASTFVETPIRTRVLAAKAIVGAATAAAVTVVIYAVVVPVTMVAIWQRDLDMVVDGAATLGLLGRVIVAMVLTTLIGVAVAGAVRNRAAALVGVVVWLALAEPIIGSLLKIPEYLPSAAVLALVSGGAGTDAAAPAAGLVLLGTVIAAGAAAFVTLRNDVA